MTSIFLLFLTVVFMLFEVPQLPAKLQQIMIRPVEGMGAIQRALDSVSRYLVLKTAISLVTGLVVWGMLVALDVRFAFVWGLLAFALNYIPNIGSVLAAIPPILQVLVFSGLYDALILLAAYLVINLVFGNILEPRMMGRAWAFHPGGIFVPDFLGLAARPGRYVAFRTADHHRENWSGANGGWAKHRHIAQ
jgi:AI-2 transport protein TqsA